jgi:hypothetical protein
MSNRLVRGCPKEVEKVGLPIRDRPEGKQRVQRIDTSRWERTKGVRLVMVMTEVDMRRTACVPRRSGLG